MQADWPAESKADRHRKRKNISIFTVKNYRFKKPNSENASLRKCSYHQPLGAGGEQPVSGNWEDLSPHSPRIVAFRGRSGKCRHFVCSLKYLPSGPLPTHNPSVLRKSLEASIGVISGYPLSLREQLLRTLFMI